MFGGTKHPSHPANRGTSLLETILALGVSALVLGGASEHARAACATAREARAITSALTSARNVLDTALATPCVPVQNALGVCGHDVLCTITANEIGRRAAPSGTIVLVRLVVDVKTATESLDERRLARVAGVAARPEVCG